MIAGFMALSVTIYMRPGCHLCEEAADRLRTIAAGQPGGESLIELDEVDIEGNDELHARFLELIPVIEIEGEIVSQLIEYRDRAFADKIVDRLAASY